MGDVRSDGSARESVLCLVCLEPVQAEKLQAHTLGAHGAALAPDPLLPGNAARTERSPELLQAAALLAGGQDDDALQALETAVERDPQVEEVWFQKAMLHIARREFGEALLCLERATSIDGRDARAWVAKFFALERVGGRSAEAARCLIRAADLDPLFTQRWIAERFTEDELKEIRRRYGGGPR